MPITAQDVQEYLATKKIDAQEHATHHCIAPHPAYLRPGDTDDESTQLSRFVYEANRMKEPIAMREMLPEVFALFFSMEVRGNREAGKDMIKKIAGFIGKALPEFYAQIEAIKAVIYTAELDDDIVKGQVVFPDILVDRDRHQKLRTALLDEMSQKGNAIAAEMAKLHYGNNPGCVLKTVDYALGIEIPLCATTRLPARTPEAPLNPLALATITAGVVARAEPPNQDSRWMWVKMGLKRRDQGDATKRKPTDWKEPRGFRGKEKGREGSSGKSSGGSGSTGAGSGGKYAKDK